MMIEPPIDKLVDKVGCKYALCSLITKRAKILLDKKGEMLAATGKRSVSVAAKEVFDGIVEMRIEG